MSVVGIISQELASLGTRKLYSIPTKIERFLVKFYEIHAFQTEPYETKEKVYYGCVKL